MLNFGELWLKQGIPFSDSTICRILLISLSLNRVFVFWGMGIDLALCRKPIGFATCCEYIWWQCIQWSSWHRIEAAAAVQILVNLFVGSLTVSQHHRSPIIVRLNRITNPFQLWFPYLNCPCVSGAKLTFARHTRRSIPKFRLHGAASWSTRQPWTSGRAHGSWRTALWAYGH